ncbi:MAG: S1/P1 nuclease [Gemmataceae bacterium]|nr:S1/P1 nuclease [Gemmataceae bacterium]
MRRLLVIVLIAAFQVWPVPVVQAWNSIGHMAIAKLAYDRLSDAEQARLFVLLKQHPHYERYLAAGRPADISEAEWVVARCAVWPDWVRPRGAKDPRGPEVTKYNRPEDHYINLPFIDPKDAEAFAGKVLIDPDQTNILDALKQRSNELRTKTADPADKAVAVCWLFHLIGDIHQPLHNVAYFSDTAEFRRGDQGGNLFGVKVNGERTKLHMYWDDLLGRDPDYADDSPAHQAKIFRQALDAAAALRDLALSPADEARLRDNTTYESWSREGFELAKSVAYQKTDGSGLLPGVLVPFKGPIPETAPEVGEAYVRLARATAEVRVVLAARRLAARLKKQF